MNKTLNSQTAITKDPVDEFDGVALDGDPLDAASAEVDGAPLDTESTGGLDGLPLDGDPLDGVPRELLLCHNSSFR